MFPPNAQILLLLLLLAVWNPVCLAFSVTHPNIDLRSLEQLGISGSYKGISVYRDTEQLTQIPKSTSSVISFSNDTLKLIGSSNIDGTILDTCIVNETLYFAGNFSTINGQSVNHIAALDLSTKKISSLKRGLDGVVYSLYCDTHKIYVGGSFIAPVDNTIEYSDSLSTFGGSVAVWEADQWHGLPWKGLNGPVYSITKVADLLYFGGKFDTATDGQSYHAPASQPISIPSTGVTAVNTSSTSPTAASILCADASNTQPWLLTDGATGTWQASFVYYSVNPVLIRIVNSKLANHQTNEFAVRSLTDSTIFELTYLDPENNITKTCTTDCKLSKSLDVGYQDFRITNLSLTTGIAIDIKSWYGVSGGLASVKIFQSEIFAYAVPVETNNICASSSNLDLPRVVKSGSGWIDTTGAGAYSAVTVGSDAAQPSATFYPNLAESGFYQVLLYSPTCDNCTTVDVSVYATSDSVVSTNVSINQQTFTSATIYSGYFDVSSSFQPHITLTLGHNVTVSSSNPANMVAHAVQFIKDTSLGGMTSVLQYNTSSPMATTKEAVPWKILTENLPAQSVVKSMATVDKSFYLGGSFSGTDKSNAKYVNLVQYDTTTNQLKSVPNSGLNGPVNDIVCTTIDCFVGGEFTSLAANSTLNLSNIAQYNLQKAAWTSLEGGVDGSVHSVALVNSQVLVTGNFTHLQSNNISAPGNAWWNKESDSWASQNTSLPFLAGPISNAYSHGDVTYYLGNISYAQRYQSSGISFITSTSDSMELSPMNSFSPLDSSTSVISSGVLFKSNTTAKNSTGTTILGGSFHLSNNIQNVAIYDHGEWSGIQGTDWQGSVNSMAVNNDLLYVGGKFTGSKINNLAVFNLTNKEAFLIPQLATGDGSTAYVSTIRHIPTQEMVVVGGHFDSIDTVTCSSVCGISTANHSWTVLGAGLTGQVADILPINNSLIVVSGNLTLNNSPLLIAEYDFEKNTWGPLGTADLPGPSNHIAYDNITQSLYISGESDNSSFLRVWNGQRFVAPSSQLGPGSTIQQLTMLPVRDNSARNVLLASGFLNLGDYGNVSAAFFDGSSWIPYLVTSGSTGEASLGSLFYLDQPYTVIVKAIVHHLPRPAVILISIASSLGIVFLLAGGAMGLVCMKRKRDRKIDPQAHPSTYYGKPPRAPESLLAALKQSTPPEDDEDDDIAEKRLQGENDQEAFYNILKGISSDHLSDPAFATGTAAAAAATAMTTARAAPTTHSRHSSSHNYFYNPANSPLPNASSTAVAQITAPPPVAAALTNKYVSAVRPESFTRPYSEIQLDPTTDSYHNGHPSREMAEVPNQGYGSHNPFRASILDSTTAASSGNGDRAFVTAAAASAAAAAAIAGFPSKNDNQDHNTASNSPNNQSRSMSNNGIYNQPSHYQPQAMQYANIGSTAPSNTANINSDAMQPDGQRGLTAPPVASSVRWTNTPDATGAASYAVVKPISMVGQSDGSSSLVDPISGPGTASSAAAADAQASSRAVRWTNVADSNNAAGYAVVKPVSMIDSTNGSISASEPSYVAENAPSIAIHASGPNDNEGDKDASSNVRWTNYNADSAVSMMAIEPVNVRDSTFSGYESHHTSDLDFLNGTVADGLFSNDPELARWTTSPNNADLGEKRGSNGRGQYQAALATSAWNFDESDTSLARPNDSSNEINTNAFRVSDASSLPPLDTNFASDRDQQAVLSPDSAVRWKTTNVGSPIETAHAAPILEPSSAKITRRSAHITTPSFENYYRPSNNTVTQAQTDYFTREATVPKEKSNPFTQTTLVAHDDAHNDDQLNDQVDSGPSSNSFTADSSRLAAPNTSHKQSGAIKDIIASRDLNTLSALIDEELSSPSQGDDLEPPRKPLDPADIVPSTSTGSHTSTSSGKSALEGRAASKRMVEEYLVNRKATPKSKTDTVPPTDKKDKYKSDFKTIMQSAFTNNVKSEIATEDEPHLYYAKFDFDSREPGELGFVANDPIVVVDSSDDIWWIGYKADKSDGSYIQGAFPFNYVEKAENIRE